MFVEPAEGVNVQLLSIRVPAGGDLKRDVVGLVVQFVKAANF